MCKEVESDRLNKDLAKNAKQPINVLGINKVLPPVTDTNERSSNEANACITRIEANDNVIMDSFSDTPGEMNDANDVTKIPFRV